MGLGDLPNANGERVIFVVVIFPAEVGLQDLRDVEGMVGEMNKNLLLEKQMSMTFFFGVKTENAGRLHHNKCFLYLG